jgi:hypothetical protein
LSKLAKIKRFIVFHGKRRHADLVPARTESLRIELTLLSAIVPDKQFC